MGKYIKHSSVASYINRDVLWPTVPLLVSFLPVVEGTVPTTQDHLNSQLLTSQLSIHHVGSYQASFGPALESEVRSISLESWLDAWLFAFLHVYLSILSGCSTVLPPSSILVSSPTS